MSEGKKLSDEEKKYIKQQEIQKAQADYLKKLQSGQVSHQYDEKDLKIVNSGHLNKESNKLRSTVNAATSGAALARNNVSVEGARKEMQKSMDMEKDAAGGMEFDGAKAAEMAPEIGKMMGVKGGAGKGALQGASMGTQIGGPGWGTLIGAVVGGVAGGLQEKAAKKAAQRKQYFAGKQAESEAEAESLEQADKGRQAALSGLRQSFASTLEEDLKVKL